MNTLHFSDNITRLRHEKKITQEQLADFVGVTKASVSKWENGQSLPDILMLPQLAVFFDVTIDELLGYAPQLGREQIQKIYLELAEDFSKQPFEEVMKKSEAMVKQYYSCYPFLYEICSLWLNHFMLAKETERQMEVLKMASDLCSHISQGSSSIGLCSDAVLLKASIDLMRGMAGEVIEALEEIQNPCRLTQQGNGVLIQAYQAAGNLDKADSFTQINMYTGLLAMVGYATEYLRIHTGNLKICEETIRRVQILIKTYELELLHPNSVALFYYQAALVYCTHKKKTEALQMLEAFVKNVERIVTKDCAMLHGDAYFNRIEEWFEQLTLGVNAPREKKVIYEGALQALEHPVFAVLKEEEAYRKIKEAAVRKGEKL